MFHFYLQLRNASEMTSYVKDQAENMMDKINRTKTKYEQEKTDTKALIEKVKTYLQGTARTDQLVSFWI